MQSLYPSTFASLRTWAAQNNVTITEARVRFAQYAVLRAVAASRRLSSLLVLKGGNALDFIWQPNRSTKDLDFSADMFAQDSTPTMALLESQMAEALGNSSRQFGITFLIQKRVQQPPGLDKTFITYTLNVGYALADEVPLRERLAAGMPSPNVIPLEISLNEPICADEPVDISGTYPLRVSTVEDILAEKLRALLQQPIRNRTRRQDLLDVAVILRTQVGIDGTRVSEFLLRKAKARDVKVSKRGFLHPEVATRAMQDYDSLQQTTRGMFIPVDEALQALYEFANRLEIPEE